MVSVTADIREPITEIEATGTVEFRLAQPFVLGGVVYGTNTVIAETVTAGNFPAPVQIYATAVWQITVQTDKWRDQFTVQVPASPSPTTLAALFALSQASPALPALYVPLSQRGALGGVAVLDPITGLVPANELPNPQAAPWLVAKKYAGLSNPAALVNYPGNDPNNPITLASGIYQNYRFICTQLIIPNNNTKLINCDIITSNASFGIRLDANTGLETGRYLEHCRVTGTGVAFSGAGFRARLCEVYNNGDDSARIGRSHAEPTIFESCYFHDFKPQASAHADGVQIQTVPAADVVVWGCYISMNTATGYVLPGGAGYTGAIFVDTSDVPIAGGDSEPTRAGMIWVDSCYLVSSQNYTVVVDGPNTDISNCMILPGTTAAESIQPGTTVSGHNNVNADFTPIVDTDLSGRTQRFVAVADPRILLRSLGDVDLAGLADTNVLAWNAAESLWEPATAGGGGGGSTTLAGLTDVNVAGMTDGQVLEWIAAASKWEPRTVSGGGGGTPMAIVSGRITTGNVSAVNTAGNWLPIAGTSQQLAAVVGDQIRAEYGFLTSAGSGTYYDIGVVVGGSIVRLLNAPGFPPDAGYEGMPEANPDVPSQFFGPAVDPWFTAASGDLAGGNVTFCLAWRSGGNGALEMNVDIPVSFNLYNNHH
jgi:hypothetical protein